MCHVSPVKCHISSVTSQLSYITCHLTTTLCCFSCSESPKKIGVATVEGLVIDKVNKHLFGKKKYQFWFGQFKEEAL